MNSSGFSLLELLIVIAISAIVASLSLHSWQDLKKRNELSDTTFQLMRFLNEVKLDANLTNANHSIYLFTYPSNHWCLAVAGEERPLNCQTRFHFQGDQNITISGLTTTSSIAFYGKRSMAQSGTIKLKNAIGETKIIISTRGRIRYCSNNTFLSGFIKC